MDIPGWFGLLPKTPNPVVGAEVPKGFVELLPNTGTVDEVDDVNVGTPLEDPPKSGAALELENTFPVAVEEVEDAAPVPKPPNFGVSEF